jgi:PIN domain nuclease of toxin-antitoxin system
MDYLLDTHAVLWFFDNPAKLSRTAYELIVNEDNEIYVSIASIWEVAVKVNIGKLDLKNGFDRFCEMIDENGFILLPIEFKHLRKLQNLPFIHRDPFDRLLIAIATAEDLAFISVDENIPKYDIKCLW